MLTVVPGPASGDEDRPAASDSSSLIDLVVREGARRMLAEALQAEVDAYIAAYTDQRDEHGHRLVVRNGCHQPREVLTSAGAATANPPNPGRTCYATANAAACAPPYSRSGTARSGSGARCARCSRKPASSAAGSTRSPTSWPRTEVRASRGEEGLAEIWNAEDKRHALDAVKAFDAAYGTKFPKAAAKITEDADELLAFYDYPAEHWVHLRTTNPIESTFSTVRHRTKLTKGPGSRAAGLAMAFKLIESAQARWRAVNAPHLVALVRADARFENEKLVERPDDHTHPTAA